MGKLEVLAPAGGQEQLEAAVRSGANAVYLGLDKFNARANAHNFDDAKSVVSYCHARNVKVHITLNTLIKDSEIPELISTIKEIADSGADAVIVQDLATAKLVKTMVPSLSMHASTQMTVHNVDGVRVLEKLGFSRVVLARELTLEEIRYICENTKLEVEVFVHGALCMCTSGCCYLSSILGQRSGNRGYCAQPCRLNFKCNDREYALSLKDMCSIPYIEELEKAGVCSLKIEGRMKRPEYVSASTVSCNNQINGLDPDLDTLRAVFSRSGFTDGYIKNHINRTMFGFRQRDDVISAETVFKKIQQYYKNEVGLVPVNFKFFAKKDQQMKLEATCLDKEIIATGNVPEAALNNATTQETVIEKLKKTGGTQFFVDRIDVDLDDDLFIPIVEINAMRRDVIDRLNNELSINKPHKVFDEKYEIIDGIHSSNPEVYVRCETYEQAMSVKNASKIMVPAEEIIKHPDLVGIFAEKLIAVAPQLEWKTDKLLYEIKKIGVSRVLADNIWVINKCQELGLEMLGGHGLNIFNSIAINEYKKLGIKETIVSFELTLENIEKIKSSIPKGIIAYGNLPIMQVRSCPARYDNGCGNCDGHPILKDRYDTEFSIMCHSRKYSTIINSVPLDLRGKKIQNIDFVVLWFTTETQKECKEIYNSYAKGNIEKQQPVPKLTRGLYYKEVL